MGSLNIDEIVEVFFSRKGELKMQEIKDRVLQKRNGNFDGYAHLNSFNQTIQSMVQSHCIDGHGYNEISIFKKLKRGYYCLQDHDHMVNLWKSLEDK